MDAEAHINKMWPVQIVPIHFRTQQLKKHPRWLPKDSVEISLIARHQSRVGLWQQAILDSNRWKKDFALLGHVKIRRSPEVLPDHRSWFAWRVSARSNRRLLRSRVWSHPTSIRDNEVDIVSIGRRFDLWPNPLGNPSIPIWPNFCLIISGNPLINFCYVRLF
jgi:hypothetical protein